MPMAVRQNQAAGHRKGDRVVAGIICASLAAFLFVGQDAGVKWIAPELAIMQILFLRSAFGVVLCLIYFSTLGSFDELWVAQPILMIVRCLINFGAWCMFFTGLKHLPLADALAIFFMFPVVITALSAPVLGEPVGLKRTLAIVAGFIGVLVMLNPTAGIEWPAMLALGAACCWAVVALMTRKLSRTETPMCMLFYTLSTFVALAFAPQFLVWEMPSNEAWMLIPLIAALGVAAQFFIIQAYSITTPSVTAPFEYTAIIWAVILGYFLWGDVPELHALVGGSIIILSGLYIMHRETQVARNKTPEANDDGY